MGLAMCGGVVSFAYRAVSQENSLALHFFQVERCII